MLSSFYGCDKPFQFKVACASVIFIVYSVVNKTFVLGCESTFSKSCFCIIKVYRRNKYE